MCGKSEYAELAKRVEVVERLQVVVAALQDGLDAAETMIEALAKEAGGRDVRIEAEGLVAEGFADRIERLERDLTKAGKQIEKAGAPDLVACIEQRDGWMDRQSQRMDRLEERLEESFAGRIDSHSERLEGLRTQMDRLDERLARLAKVWEGERPAKAKKGGV